MSRTEQRNGIRVQRAVHHLSTDNVGGINHFVTVGQVAEEAECSRPTALKYLRVLEEYGMVEIMKLFNGQYLINWKGAK